ncbi:acetate--CoA ligase family protein, partial [Trinickia sp.]|uniref:acetate--CoA ligase family protein n=1 Tax=Trinickia sp. TaxID=2571163 RepID=UPI003F8204CB
MTVRNLDRLFRPTSIAVVGASVRAESVGAKVWRRVRAGGFEGPVWPVNPKYAELDGCTVFSDVADLLEAPCVALICTPSHTWPDIVGKLGRLGTRAAIIVSDTKRGAKSASLARALEAAKPYLLRIVGPGSLGVVTPALNAHLGAPSSTVKRGGVAWVSQSNALTNAVLGWAQARGLGFSHAIALGGEADVDAGDVLDYLASDPGTRAILLELSVVRAARKFMSAARAAARNKPVLVLRTGRGDPADPLYAAAFRRAGMVRVESLDDLIDEIETLGVGRVAASSTATLITSDRGVAALASDAFAQADTTLADWPDAAVASIVSALPAVVEPGNPLVLGNDAKAEDFGTALEALAPHRETGTAFVVHASTLSAPVADVARVLIERQRFAYRGLLTCFFGGVDEQTRDALRAHGIAVHSTPHRLARAFARLVDYRLSRELLMETPQGLPAQVPASIKAAQEQAKTALESGRTALIGEDAAQLLRGFGLQVADDRPTATLASGEGDGEGIGHIVDVAVRLRDDADFGPVFEFAAPAIDGLWAPFMAYGLLPLNPVLAREIVSRSPYAMLAPIGLVLDALTALSEAVCCVEQIVGFTALLRVTRTQVQLVDPRITLGPVRGRLAIVPYPRQLEETIDWHGERLTIRPIRPEDEAAHSALIAAMTA